MADLPPPAPALLCKELILAENSSYDSMQEVGMLLFVPGSSISLKREIAAASFQPQERRA